MTSVDFEFDTSLREAARKRAALKREDAADLRKQAAALDAGAAILERTWSLPIQEVDNVDAS